MDKLRITTYNCNSFRRQIDVIRELMAFNDIVLLQEIFLLSDDFDILEGIHTDFDFSVTPSVCNGNSTNIGRPKGGLVIFWRKSLSKVLRPVLFNDNVMGLQISLSHESLLLLNVYFPCDNFTIDALNLYRNLLACINNIIQETTVDKVVVCGDFNADPLKGRFWNELSNFVNELSFSVVDQTLPVDTFTYLSPSHNSTSWLDHIVASHADIISNISVSYDITIDDHFPLVFWLHFENELTSDLNTANKTLSTDRFVNWSKFSEQNIVKYKHNLDQLLSVFQSDVFRCGETSCCSVNHVHSKSCLYD